MTDSGRELPDENLMTLLVTVEAHAKEGGKKATPRVWRCLGRDVEAAHRDRQELLLAYEDAKELRGALSASLERERRLQESIEAAVIDLQTLTLTDQLHAESTAIGRVAWVLNQALILSGEADEGD
jgi:hypothetical protein